MRRAGFGQQDADFAGLQPRNNLLGGGQIGSKKIVQRGIKALAGKRHLAQRVSVAVVIRSHGNLLYTTISSRYSTIKVQKQSSPIRGKQKQPFTPTVSAAPGFQNRCGSAVALSLHGARTVECL